MTYFYKLFCTSLVVSALYSDFRGWTYGSFMPWASSRRYESSLHHK